MEQTSTNNNQNPEKAIAESVAKIIGSAKWFYWIAGLSMLNTIIILFKGDVSFIVGLGITQIADAFVYEAPASFKLIAFMFDLFVAGIFILFGYYATRLEKWAFQIGMVLYFIDGLLFLIIQDWLSIGFHIWVLFSLYKGLKLLKEIRTLGFEKSENSILTEWIEKDN